MAKLDKQGLNTFIRELDKHINTKINRLDISPTAEKVIMADGSNVEETVNANKTSIQSANNNISTLQSAVSSLQNELSTNKSTLQNNINAIREVL